MRSNMEAMAKWAATDSRFTSAGSTHFSKPSCFRHDLAMDFGRHANQKLPGKRLLRVFPAGGAEVQVVIHRVFEGLFQFPDGSSLKGDHVSRVDHLTVKHARFLIQLYF